MAGLFTQLGQKASGTAKGAVYSAVGPDLLAAFAMASSVGTTVKDTIKEIRSVGDKKDSADSKSSKKTEALVDATGKQVDVLSDVRDTLSEINKTNKKIRQAEKIKADKEKFQEIEDRLERKSSLSATVTKGIKSAGGILDQPWAKFLLALVGGAIAWNTLLTDEQKQAIIDKGVAFLEGVLGMDQGRITEWMGKLSTFGNGLAAAAAGLFFLGKLAAMRPPPVSPGSGPGTRPQQRPTNNPNRSSAPPPRTAPPQNNGQGRNTRNPDVRGTNNGVRSLPSGRVNPRATPQATPRSGLRLPRIFQGGGGAPPGARWDPRVNRWRDIATGRYVPRAMPPASAIARVVGQQATSKGILAGLKNIPLFGLLFSGGESAYRYFGRDDPEGSALAASQALGAIPSGVTNAAALSAAVALLAMDIFEIFHPEGKRPSLLGTSNDRYVSLRDDPFAMQLYTTVQEQALKALGFGTTANDFLTMEAAGQSAEIQFLQGTAFGQQLQSMLDRGEITAEEYTNAIANYSQAVSRGAQTLQMQGQGDQSIFNVTGNISQNVSTNEFEYIGSASVSDPSDNPDYTHVQR